MKEKKINKNNTKKKLPSILGTTQTNEYLRTNPVSEEFINHVCERLLEYSCSEDALFVEGFRRTMRIPKRTYHNWLKTWPQLKEAHEEALHNIAYGRMEGAIKKRFDKGAILHSQYRFGNEWKQDDQYQAELKKTSEHNDNQKQINVYISKDEDTGIRPAIKQRELKHD